MCTLEWTGEAEGLGPLIFLGFLTLCEELALPCWEMLPCEGAKGAVTEGVANLGISWGIPDQGRLYQVLNNPDGDDGAWPSHGICKQWQDREEGK